MNWAGILSLSVLLFAILSIAFIAALHLLKVNWFLDLEYPSRARWRAGVSFLGFYREIFSENGAAQASVAAPSQATAGPAAGREKFVRAPSVRLPARFRKRLRRALLKWVSDIRIWTSLAGYGFRLTRRALKTLRPSLESLRVRSADVEALGRFAALWSAVSAALPFLSAPVEYGFDRPFALEIRLKGRFSGLELSTFLLIALFAFPWVLLTRRFLRAFANPALNRWQRLLYAGVRSP